MKRLIIISLILAILSLGLTSCFRVSIQAPRESEVSIVSEYTVLPQFTLKKKVWYILWGLVPITDNTPADLIALSKAKKVRINTYWGVDDILINLITANFTIYVNTLEVEVIE